MQRRVSTSAGPFRLADAREVLAILWRVIRAQTGGPRTAGATSLILDPDGRLLLVRTRYQRGWCCSGGYLDPGEDPTDGIRRELAEEIGLPADAVPTLLHTIELTSHTDTVFTLQVDAVQAEALHPVSWEILELRWFGPFELPQLNSGTRRLLQARASLIEVHQQRWRFV